jgi:hypothetical protein
MGLANDLEPVVPVPALDAVRVEVIAINRENAFQPLGFRQGNQRSVSEIHRSNCVLNHQLEAAAQQPIVEGPNRQPGFRNEVHQSLRTCAARSEQVKRFGENGDRRGEWLFDRLQHTNAMRMGVVRGVEQRNQRAGIDEINVGAFS